MNDWLDRLLRPECHRVRTLMDAWLDGELAPDQAHRVAAHLQDCARCGVELETYQRVKDSLAAVAVHLRPPADPEALARLQQFADDLTGTE